VCNWFPLTDLQLRDAIESAAAVVSLASVNKHFSIPEPVSSIYTGREGLLEDLRRMMFAPAAATHGHTQRRFVIYGLSGSGKTQFCCKFAQEHRQRWVFSTQNLDSYTAP